MPVVVAEARAVAAAAAGIHHMSYGGYNDPTPWAGAGTHRKSCVGYNAPTQTLDSCRHAASASRKNPVGSTLDARVEASPCNHPWCSRHCPLWDKGLLVPEDSQEQNDPVDKPER